MHGATLDGLVANAVHHPQHGFVCSASPFLQSGKEMKAVALRLPSHPEHKTGVGALALGLLLDRLDPTEALPHPALTKSQKQNMPPGRDPNPARRLEP